MPDYKKLIRKKVTTRKVTPKTERPRKYLAKIMSLFILVVLILAAYLGMRSFLPNFSIFKIREVVIVNQYGRAINNPEDFFRLEKDLNLFSFDMERVSQDIQARHPEIADISIHKQFPQKLLIVIKERDPVALISFGRGRSDRIYLVDAEAFVLPAQDTNSSLPEIVGIHPRQIQLFTKSKSPRLRKALILLNELKKAKVYPEYKVWQIDTGRYSDIVFYLRDKTQVKMGKGGFGKKAALLSEILTQLKTTNTAPKYIDMRFDNPVVRP